MTLLEMVVAMFIVAIMMTFLIPLYIRTMKVKSRIEQSATLTARGRGAMGILRRDLTGAFRTAVAMYDFGGAHSSGSEFHWEAPVYHPDHPGEPAFILGFRRLTFVGAVDGSRVNGDPMRDYDYARVSWALKGTLQRMVTVLSISKIDPEGTTWQTEPGVEKGVSLAAGFADVGAYRGAPYLIGAGAPAQTIRLYGQLMRGRFTFIYDTNTVTGIGTKFKDDIDAGDLIMGGKDGKWAEVASEPTIDGLLTLLAPYDGEDSVGVGMLKKSISVTATVCWPRLVTPVPDWLELDWKLTVGSVAKGGTPYDLYSKFCPTNGVPVGANTGSTPFFIIVEPGWWSMGEEAEDLVFYPPAGYTPAGPTDGVYTGGVPSYVDVRLKISDPEYRPGQASAGVRTFSERVAIPAGVSP
jgi:hypothetical protein